jgi:hypothetical protein
LAAIALAREQLRGRGRARFQYMPSLAAVRLAKPPAVVRHPRRRGLLPSRSNA